MPSRRRAEQPISVGAVAILSAVAVAASPFGSPTVRAQPSEGGHIAFERFGDERPCSGEIWVANADGSRQRRLIGGRTTGCSPRWSPDGQLLAFARRGRGVWIADANGTVIRQVTGGADVKPRWSPDGMRIVFERRTEGRLGAEVYIVRVDGSGLIRLAGGPWYDGRPDWSPDGLRILFLSDRENWTVCPSCRAICLIRPDRRAFRRITAKGVDASAAEWSPDGESIAWVRRAPIDAEPRLVVMRADTRRVMTVARSEGEPAWSPTGRWLAYSDGAGLVRTRIDGSGRQRITRNPTDANPHWKRR